MKVDKALIILYLLILAALAIECTGEGLIGTSLRPHITNLTELTVDNPNSHPPGQSPACSEAPGEEGLSHTSPTP